MSAAQRFGGEMTEILVHSMRPTSFVPGSMIVLASGVIGYLGLEFQLPEVVVPSWMAVGTLFVVRFALNATYGDPRGGAFDTSGGPWTEVVGRALRMAILNLTWAIPVGFVLSALARATAAMNPGELPPSPLVLLLFAVGFVPPLVLVLVIATDSFAEALSPATWRRVFGGRSSELLAMFAVFIGGVAATTLGALILAYGIGGTHGALFFFVLMATLAWGMGVTHALLGGLVGGFLRAEGGEIEDGSLLDGASPVAGPAGPLPDVMPDDGFVPIDLSEMTPAFEHIEAHPQGDKAVRMADTDSLLGRLKANEHIEDDDVLLAHEDAVQMETVFGPHPQVLARIAILARRTEAEDALDAGLRAVEAARRVSNRGVLADLSEEFGESLEGEWTADECVHMAASLAARDRIESALELYKRALASVEKPLPVVKAMIQWADTLLRHESTAESALRIYDALEQACPEHPFEDFVERGRQLAERKLQRIGS